MTAPIPSLLGKTYTEAIDALADTFIKYVGSGANSSGGAVLLGKQMSEIMTVFSMSLAIIKIDMEKQVKAKLELQTAATQRLKDSRK